MTRIPAVLVLCALLSTGAGAQSIVGRWRTVERSRGGIGAVIEFYADSSMEVRPTAIVESYYRIEGRRLLMLDSAGHVGGPALVIDTLTATRLRYHRDGDTATANFTALARDGAPAAAGAPSVIGDWTGDRGGRPARWRFTASTLLFTLPIATQPGRYAVHGDSIRIEFGGGVVDGRFERHPDTLVIPSPSGRGRAHLVRD